MKKTQIYAVTVVILFLILLSSIGNATTTVRERYRAGINNWNWNARVITANFDGYSPGSSAFSPYLPDVDAVFISYDDQMTMTITPGWAYSSVTGEITVLGDTGEDFTAVIYDFPGY